MALFAYALARYRGDTYPTLLLSTITCGLVTVISVLAIIASILPVAMPIYLFTEEGIVQDCIMLGAIGAIEIILSLLLFRIKRFRAGITPEKDGNVELMVLAAAACIFLNTLFSTAPPRTLTSTSRTGKRQTNTTTPFLKSWKNTWRKSPKSPADLTTSLTM